MKMTQLFKSNLIRYIYIWIYKCTYMTVPKSLSFSFYLYILLHSVSFIFSFFFIPLFHYLIKIIVSSHLFFVFITLWRLNWKAYDSYCSLTKKTFHIVHNSTSKLKPILLNPLRKNKPVTKSPPWVLFDAKL